MVTPLVLKTLEVHNLEVNTYDLHTTTDWLLELYLFNAKSFRIYSKRGRNCRYETLINFKIQNLFNLWTRKKKKKAWPLNGFFDLIVAWCLQSFIKFHIHLATSWVLHMYIICIILQFIYLMYSHTYCTNIYCTAYALFLIPMHIASWIDNLYSSLCISWTVLIGFKLNMKW